MFSLQAPAMQPNAQQVHDDPASLFSRSLNFNPEVRASALKEAPRQEHSVSASPPPQPIFYSISQHYHHSAHVVKPSTQHAEALPPGHSSEPPRSDMSPSETVLRQHGIDAATLTPSQLQLFRIAQEPQKLRLIELWSICPPNRGGEIPALAWSSAMLEQEEQLARMRIERQQQDQPMSLDSTHVQTADSTWSNSDSEPYVVSGYEELMRRENEGHAAGNRSTDIYSHFGTSIGGPSYTPATDPVYLGPDVTRQQQQMDMATQYGAFEHLRGAAEADAMDVM